MGDAVPRSETLSGGLLLRWGGFFRPNTASSCGFLESAFPVFPLVFFFSSLCLSLALTVLAPGGSSCPRGSLTASLLTCEREGGQTTHGQTIHRKSIQALCRPGAWSAIIHSEVGS